MSITKDMIIERKSDLVEDLKKVQETGRVIELQRLENTALQNALTGAIQQCDDFLAKIDNELSDEGCCVHTFSNIPPPSAIKHGGL